MLAAKGPRVQGITYSLLYINRLTFHCAPVGTKNDCFPKQSMEQTHPMHAHKTTHKHKYAQQKHQIMKLTSCSVFMDKTDGLSTSPIFASLQSSSPTTSTSLSTLTLSLSSCKIEIKRHG